MIVYGLLLDMLPTSIVMMTLGGGLLLVVLVGIKKHVMKSKWMCLSKRQFDLIK